MSDVKLRKWCLATAKNWHIAKAYGSIDDVLDTAESIEDFVDGTCAECEASRSHEVTISEINELITCIKNELNRKVDKYRGGDGNIYVNATSVMKLLNTFKV